MDDWKIEPARDLGMAPVDRLRSLKRESGLISTTVHIGWWAMVRAYLNVWHRLNVIGREHIPPKPPFVLIANHSSHMDAITLASPLPWRQRDRIFPIAAGDVFFETPITAAFAAGMLNALPMWRKKCGPHALKELRHRLIEEPCAYILFPEGTRSRDGVMQPFKPGLGMLVAESNVPVVPCYLEGCFSALPPDRKWPRKRPIRLHIGEPVTFTDTANDRDGWMRVAEVTHNKVRSLADGSVSE